jgi:transglutaminase-like putative cysteine protease
VLTPIIIALQFVIIDRRPKSLAHIAVFVGVAAFALVAVRLDERDQGTGRLARTNAVTAPSKRPSLGIAMLLTFTVAASLAAVVLVGDRVSPNGVIAWRSPAGYSDDYAGSVTYNPYTDIQANLITQSNNPLFTATIEGADPESVRFRMVTLDAFKNGRWQTSRVRAFPLDEEPWISEPQEYRGPTTPIAVSVRIQNLRMPWLPTPVTATDARTDDKSDYNALRTRRLDGSLYLPGEFTYEGMEYTVVAEVPELTAADFARLARTEDGSLSPLFAAAEDDGRSLGSAPAILEVLELPNEEYWTDVPTDLGSRVAVEARFVTAYMSTNFERALALEDYFRYSGGFTYNTTVPPDFTTDNVENWLFDQTNDFTRNGYCEQFATTMALMARTLGMPSRVVLGFTPGRLLDDNTVLVMDRNAHTWVEIWIPTHGWMAFDPTPRGDYILPTTNDAFREALGFSAADYAALIPSTTLLDAASGRTGINPGIFDFEPIERTPGSGGGSDEESAGFTLPRWTLPAVIMLLVLALVAVIPPIVKRMRRRRRAKRLARGDIGAAWEDITDRLSDLGETVDAAATPLEMAESIDDVLVPLAHSYGDALYGEKNASTTVIEHATDAHARADRHLATKYSKYQRFKAVYKSTRLRRRIRGFFSRSRP